MWVRAIAAILLFWAAETLPPDQLVSSANYSTLNLADIDDDPASPDASFGTWDGNGDTSALIGFPTPTGDLTEGSGLQVFRAQIREAAGGGSNSVSWSLELWEDGVLVSVLDTGTVTDTEIINGSFDAASLGTADGSLVQAAIIQTDGGSGNPQQRNGLELGAVAWDVEYDEGDTTDPTVDTLSPLDNATDVAVDSNLVITFDETVQAVSGDVEIYETDGDVLFATIDVTGMLVVVNGSVVTINPSSNLAPSTEYYVLIDATAFDDLSGNSYAGIASSTAWSFTTEDEEAGAFVQGAIRVVVKP
jgi:hypothetical protein